jgi:hypothetical protein
MAAKQPLRKAGYRMSAMAARSFTQANAVRVAGPDRISIIGMVQLTAGSE